MHTNAEGVLARRGLHAGLIKAPPPSSRRSPGVVTPAVTSPGASPASGLGAAVAPPAAQRNTSRDATSVMLAATSPAWAHHKVDQRGREQRRGNAWQTSQMEEYQLDESQMATLSSLYEGQKFPQQPLVKGIRAVSIMDTLSQLAGTEAIAATRRHQLRSKAALPATPVPTSPTSAARIRARGRTPDWIKRIFEFAKRGQLDQLRGSLRDMEATLVRNLSDHHGNNLLHVLAGQGHTAALAWLCTSLQGAQSQLEGALVDENRSGLTPAACAVKYGHTGCVEWLVSNTRLRDKLTTRDGERCLLHTAAKYSQEGVLRWLVLAMRARHIELDQRDHSGDTPLHLAARAGGLEPCRLLLAHGADVTLKNDAGLKACDVASGAGHAAVQHYLNLFEASLGVAADLSRVQGNLDSLQAENSELRGYFRDVLSVGKRLAKERDEMCRDALGRLHKMAGLAVHDKMAAEVAELAEENRALRERLGLVAASGPADLRSLHSSPGSSCGGSVSGRSGTSWLVSGLADMEHRLLMAEEGWRKLLQRSHVTQPTSADPGKPLDILQRHMEQIESQQKSSNVHLSLEEARSLSSSESSLDTLLSLRSSAGDNIYSQLLESPKKSTPPPPLSRKRDNKEEMRRRLRELALTSESGNASVLEVIEPTTSEESDDNRSMPFLATSSPRLKALSMSLEDELEKIPESSSSRRYSSVHNLLDEPSVQPDLLIGTGGEIGDEEIISVPTPTPISNKKRTFLQKFSLKASWPSKRKVKSHKHIEISADDFKETYMSQRHILGESPCSTSSASQQELSSEEQASQPRTHSSGASTTGSEASGKTKEVVPSKSNSPAITEEVIEIKEGVAEVEYPEVPQEPPVQEEPPPPVRLIPNSPPTRHLSKSSLAEMKSGQLQHHIESMSVTTSEDSGIVARPSSSASKSDSLLSSRPDSSSSSSFKAGLFPLRLSTTELLNATGTSGRVSPAPSDVSKPDSTRQLLGKIDEARLVEGGEDKLKPAVRVKLDKIATSAAADGAEPADTKVDAECKPVSKQRSERAWYDLSDEEPDLLTSAALIRVKRTSSDEEHNS